jgi:peptidoglycan LD-endopeptidase LytH
MTGRWGHRARTPGHAVGGLLVALLLLVSAGCAALPSGRGGTSDARDQSAVDTGAAGGVGSGAAAAPGALARTRHVFPVRGRTSYSRFHHDYPATDIFAACNTRVVAPTAGVVLEISRHDHWRPAVDNPATRGGKFVSLRGVDHVRYYGSHLRGVATRVHAGRHVRAGTVLGRVGQTGNARGVGCHLHFGLSPVCAGTGDWWIRRGEVNPFRFLRAWQHHRNLSPRHAIRRWHARHGCPPRP